MTPNAQEQYSISTEDHSNQGEIGESFQMLNAQEQFPESEVAIFWVAPVTQSGLQFILLHAEIDEEMETDLSMLFIYQMSHFHLTPLSYLLYTSLQRIRLSFHG